MIKRADENVEQEQEITLVFVQYIARALDNNKLV